MGWPSARGLSVGNIADQVGCTTLALTRSIARFKAAAGLDSFSLVPRNAGQAGGGSGVSKYSQETGLSDGEINSIEIVTEPFFDLLRLPEIRPSLFNAGITRKSL